MRRLSDQQHRPRRSGGQTTRETCIQVSVSTGAFFFGRIGERESVGAREAGPAKAETEQASERTQTCVIEARKSTTQARPEIASAP